MSATIEIKQLTKYYGKRAAVEGLSLVVESGDIYGFVGPNGAGKTSTIRMIAGLLQPDNGEIFVGGHSVRQACEQVKRLIGYMPDFFGVYPDLRTWEYLEFFAACYQIPETEHPGLIDGLLELVELRHRKDDMVDRLSRGMKQRLSLARTLIHDPQVLLLDEPAAGLDPRARVEIRELLVELSRMGKTIFFSTHILADVAEICSRVGIIEAGKLIASAPLEDLQLQIVPSRQIEIELLDGQEAAQDLLMTLDGVVEISPRPAQKPAEHPLLVVEFSGDDQALSQMLAHLVHNGIPVLHFSEDNRDLEEVFLRATKGLVT
ncbi:MAG: ABC transporter ATP-binding protein [Anaerolineales bacterium]|nr:ABC transporter ATP-binding protein [Anaerolineales bacterium]